jgi:hypothetical protein
MLETPTLIQVVVLLLAGCAADLAVWDVWVPLGVEVYQPGPQVRGELAAFVGVWQGYWVSLGGLGTEGWPKS